MDSQLHNHMLKNLTFMDPSGLYYNIVCVSNLEGVGDILTYYKVSEPDNIKSMRLNKFNEVKNNERVYKFLDNCCGRI